MLRPFILSTTSQKEGKYSGTRSLVWARHLITTLAEDLASRRSNCPMTIQIRLLDIVAALISSSFHSPSPMVSYSMSSVAMKLRRRLNVYTLGPMWPAHRTRVLRVRLGIGCSATMIYLCSFLAVSDSTCKFYPASGGP